jgi:predicted nuclease of predicted toxin-antitoxin system
VGLERSDDVEIWQHARLHGLIIVTKDVDFTELSIIRSGSPKVIWVRRGNCSTRDIEQILRASCDAIERFAKSDDQVLEIG